MQKRLLFVLSFLIAFAFAINISSAVSVYPDKSCSNPQPSVGFCEGNTCVKDYYVLWGDSDCGPGPLCWCAYEFDYAKHPNTGDMCTKNSDCTFVPPTCTSWTYSSWSTCSNGQQTRTVTSSLPTGCTGGSPVTSQSCTGSNGATCTSAGQCLSGYCNPSGSCANMPPVQCTSWTYSSWSTCSNGQQTRTVTSSLPTGCAGSPPSSETSRTCTGSNGATCTAGTQCSSGYCSSGSCANPPTCTASQCTAWSACSSGSKTCTGFSSGCTAPSTSITSTSGCTQAPCVESWSCTAWSACSGGTKSRTCTDSNACGTTTSKPSTTSSEGCPQPTHNECSSYSCVQVSGSGNNACTSDNSCKKDDGASCTSGTQCKSGSCSWSWSNWKYVCGAGDSEPDPVCTGGIPSNANLCSGDDSSLSQDTSRTLVSYCTSDRKCEYTCASGYELNGGQCSLIPTGPQLSSASWNDMRDNSISGADSGDRVMMKAYGSRLAGKQVTFSWYKQGQSTALGSTTVTAQVDAFATSSAIISASGTIYFKATVEGNTVTSSNLVVSSSSSNSAPVISISSPSEGAIYFTSSSITFSHSSYDVDSNISSVQWKFGDGVSSSKSTDTHSYSSAGQKTFSLTVTDEQGASSTLSGSIMIADPNDYTIFASINKPAAGEAVVSSNLVVSYEAKSSYVIKTTTTTSSPCTAVVQCVQGTCPSSTSSSPSCASSPNAAISITGGAQPYSQTLFSWAFRDGSAVLSAESGIGKVSGTKGFASTGIKNITVEAKYTVNGKEYKSSRSNTFTLFNQRQCSTSGAVWNKISAGVIVEQKDTLSTTACAGIDLQAGTNDDCCPDGFMCSTSGSIGCKVDAQADMGCSSYTSQSTCTSDASGRVNKELLWDYYNCGKTASGKNVICSCAWNSQKSKCEFSVDSRSDSSPLTGAVSSCIYTTQTSECVDGYQNVIIQASATAANCDAKTHSCSSVYGNYEYPNLQQTQSFTMYHSCNITDSAFAAMGSPASSTTLVGREYNATCPQCYIETHQKGSTMWNCGRSTLAYNYQYMRRTEPVTYYISCSINDAELQQRKNDGYTYSWRVNRTYKASTVGEWTDTHMMATCPQSTYSSVSTSECAGSTQVLPCGRPVVALPFFSYANVAVAIALIIVVYILLRMQMKDKRNKSRRRARSR